MNRSYSELIKFDTFEERFEYLKLDGVVGSETFGSHRLLNQKFYKTPEWLSARDKVILRDNGCDLGIEGRDIKGPIFVHHLNPITEEQLLDFDYNLINPDNLICVSKRTHDAITYGSYELLIRDPIVRTPYDTCPWKRSING